MRGVAPTLHCPRCGEPHPPTGPIPDGEVLTCARCAMSYTAASGTRAAPRGALRRRRVDPAAFDQPLDPAALDERRTHVVLHEAPGELVLVLAQSPLIVLNLVGLTGPALIAVVIALVQGKRIVAAVAAAIAVVGIYLGVAAKLSHVRVEMDREWLKITTRPLPRRLARYVPVERIARVEIKLGVLQLVDAGGHTLVTLDGTSYVDLGVARAAIERALPHQPLTHTT